MVDLVTYAKFKAGDAANTANFLFVERAPEFPSTQRTRVNDRGAICVYYEGYWYVPKGEGQPRSSPSEVTLWGPLVTADAQAFKADAGKPRYDLLMDGMPNALLDVVKVLSWAVQEKKEAPWPEGGKGYVPHSWQEVPEAKRRYRAALQRHENAIARGEINDPESGLPHRAHVATNALFLAELDYLYPEIK